MSKALQLSNEQGPQHPELAVDLNTMAMVQWKLVSGILFRGYLPYVFIAQPFHYKLLDVPRICLACITYVCRRPEY